MSIRSFEEYIRVVITDVILSATVADVEKGDILQDTNIEVSVGKWEYDEGR